MLLNYLPTFEPRGWLKKFSVTGLVRSKCVEYATELLATFEPRAWLKKFRVTGSVRSKYKMLLNYQPTFVPWTSLKTSGVNQSQSNPIYACFLGQANPIYVCCFGSVNPNLT